MNTQLDTTTTTQPSAATGYPMAFEVTTLPVADVDRAKAFYLRPRLAARHRLRARPGHPRRADHPARLAGLDPVRVRPRAATSGPLTGLLLIVDDIEAAREDLISRGVDVSEIFSTVPGKGIVPGIDPERRSYLSRAVFADPDGNQWQLQEVTERLPGRV